MKKPKRKKPTKIERVSEKDPMAGYEVDCGHCGTEFTVYPYPTYCIDCGKELEPKE